MIFVINVGPSLDNSIPNVNKSPVSCMGTMIMTLIFVSPVTNEEIKKIVNSLKDSATGWDEISARFLKISIESLQHPLQHVCNLSLTEGIFPHQLKIANVIPLYKSDDPMCFNHYRPVSLLCILSKVFENVMYCRLLDY